MLSVTLTDYETGQPIEIDITNCATFAAGSMAGLSTKLIVTELPSEGEPKHREYEVREAFFGVTAMLQAKGVRKSSDT